MSFEQFKASLTQSEPPHGLAPLLQAMWWDAKGNWENAHNIAQDADEPNGAWVHAYLHRKEGDNSNAGYWYARAGKKISAESLSQEWENISSALLALHDCS